MFCQNMKLFRTSTFEKFSSKLLLHASFMTLNVSSKLSCGKLIPFQQVHISTIYLSMLFTYLFTIYVCLLVLLIHHYLEFWSKQNHLLFIFVKMNELKIEIENSADKLLIRRKPSANSSSWF